MVSLAGVKQYDVSPRTFPATKGLNEGCSPTVLFESCHLDALPEHVTYVSMCLE